MTSAEKGARVRSGALRRYESWYLLTRPEHDYEVLVNKAALFNKPKLAKRLWKLFLGNGLLASDGDFWRRQHKLVLPGFHKQRIEAYADVMVRYTEDMLAGFKDGEQRDVCEDMTDLTLANRCQDALRLRRDALGAQGGGGHQAPERIMVDHVNNPFRCRMWWPSDRNRRKMSANLRHGPSYATDRRSAAARSRIAETSCRCWCTPRTRAAQDERRGAARRGDDPAVRRP